MTQHFTKRLRQGRPIEGQEANAVDTVALLSGVNMSSVVKVFAALDALEIHLGYQPRRLTAIMNMTTEVVRFDGTDDHRIFATRRLCEHVAADPRVRYTDYILHLGDKFRVKTGVET